MYKRISTKNIYLECVSWINVYDGLPNRTPAFMARPARAVAPLPENVALRCAGPVGRRLGIGGFQPGDLPEVAGNFPKTWGSKSPFPSAARTSHQQGWACGDALREWQTLIVGRCAKVFP